MRSCSAKTEKEDLFFADVVKPNVMEEHERGDIPAPRCENDAAPPHVAASGVNGEGDNCGGDDVHGERERIGLAHARRHRQTALVAMVAAAEGKNCWSGKERGKMNRRCPSITRASEACSVGRIGCCDASVRTNGQ